MVSESTMDLLSSIRIHDLCSNSCSCTDQELQKQCPHVLNKEQTLLDYMGELYYTNKKSSAGNLFTSITKDIIRAGVFNVELRINDELIYSNLANPEPSKQGVEALISSKKVIFGFYEADGGQVFFWGPYLAEVNVW
jgi:hypothetical protein